MISDKARGKNLIATNKNFVRELKKLFSRFYATFAIQWEEEEKLKSFPLKWHFANKDFKAHRSEVFLSPERCSRTINCTTSRRPNFFYLFQKSLDRLSAPESSTDACCLGRESRSVTSRTLLLNLNVVVGFVEFLVDDFEWAKKLESLIKWFANGGRTTNDFTSSKLFIMLIGLVCKPFAPPLVTVGLIM